jgi:hypothetical protein
VRKYIQPLHSFESTVAGWVIQYNNPSRLLARYSHRHPARILLPSGDTATHPRMDHGTTRALRHPAGLPRDQPAGLRGYARPVGGRRAGPGHRRRYAPGRGGPARGVLRDA